MPVLRARDTILTGARFVIADEVHADLALHIADGVIAAVGPAPAPVTNGPTVVDLEGAWALPGYVDLHMHGGGGHGVADSPDAMQAAVAFHHAHGTTSTLVSLMTAPVDDLVAQLGWVARLTRHGPGARGTVLGAHLEGPFLSTRRCGAQNGAYMSAPDPAVLDRLLAAADGTLRVMTLAPELDGALPLIERLTAAGVVAALGHSDATYEQAMAATRAGARHTTHLFNAMARLHHREPGLAGAALGAGLSVELINDGRHVHPALVGVVAGTNPCPVFVTDAIAAAGTGDGTVVLGGQEVDVRDGEARLRRTGTLAGSTLTMDEAVRRAVHDAGLTLPAASAAASGNPARVLGLEASIGSLAAGHRADLVVLDDDLRVRAVMTGGRWADRERLRS